MEATAVNSLRQQLYSLIDTKAPYEEIVKKSQELDVHIAAQQRTIYDNWKGGQRVSQAVTVLVIKGTSSNVCSRLKALTETEFAGMKASAISAAKCRG